MLQGNEVVREGLKTSLHTKFIERPSENFNTTTAHIRRGSGGGRAGEHAEVHG